MTAHDDGATARTALAQLDAVLAAWVAHLRELTSKDGRVSNELLDRHQVVAFDLAHATAAVEAARESLRFAEGAGPLERALAVSFAGDAVTRVRDLVARDPAACGISEELRQRTVESSEVRAFVAYATSPARADEIVALLEDSPSGPSRGLEEHHVSYAEEFRRFAQNVVAPQAEKIHRHDLLVPKEILDGLRELGCFGLSIPERFGGIQPDEAPDNIGMIVVTEELSRASLAAAGSLITRPEILAKALLKGGTEAQQAYWLPRLASGESMVAVAVTEPDYGSDVAGVKLTATRTEGGWLLDGVKTWCTFGGYADTLMVLARTDPDPKAGHRGLSLFIATKPRFEGHDFEHVQTESDGRAGGRIEGRAIGTIGYRGMHSYECAFERYFVPAENLLGGDGALGKGFYLQMEGFSGGRLQTAARALGVMQAAQETAFSYARDRRIFGKPEIAYQLTRVKLAKMAALVHAARQLTYRAARLVDAHRGQMECSLVKLFSCRAAEWVTREAMQIHGGMGYAEEFAVSRYFVDARVLSIFEGAEEVLALRVIARALLEAEGATT
ncbi:MAG: acyl-CoA dehydrogenase family protein [Deltaproteobacteria bacterium]|nr:acyl-CoA dehydrogenase family protein [Deltaproteobacteria bacterium]